MNRMGEGVEMPETDANAEVRFDARPTRNTRLAPAVLSSLVARRICLIKPSSLGDIVQTLPVLSALRLRFPSSHISWIVNRCWAPLLRPIPLIDEIIEFDRDALRASAGVTSRRSQKVVFAAREFLSFLRQLGDHRFDLAIDLQGLLRAGLMVRATGAKRRIGLASAREGARLFYTDVIDDHPMEQSAVNRYWQIADALGVGESPKRFCLSLSAEERTYARTMLSGLPRPIVGVNPAARWETKRWPAESFADAATLALMGSGGSVAILGGPGDEAIAARVANRLALPNRDLSGRMTLRQLAAVLEQCDVVLTNDSGPMHLAAAVGVATVAIFTCTSPSRAGPFGVGHRIVQTCVSCRSSYLKQCDRLECMRELTPERVVPALRAALFGSDAVLQISSEEGKAA